MGIFWDNPDSPDVRRKAEEERRRRAAERERDARKERQKLDKIRGEQRRAEEKARQTEDDKAIAELQKKFMGDQAQQAKDAKAAHGLNRGPGLTSNGALYRNPNIELATGMGNPMGFNPNAPREGQPSEISSKNSSAKTNSEPTGPKLPRPF